MMTEYVPYTTSVITLCPENTVHDALCLMRKNDMKHLVIVSDNIPVGMVTERDVGKFLQNDKTSRMLDRINLHEIMSKTLFTISKDQDELLTQCAIRMDAFQIGSIVILDNEKLVGIITKSDLTKNFSRSFAGVYQVKDYMNNKMITCRKSDSLLFALVMLNRNKVARLVVTDNDGKPAGVISYDRFLRNSEYFKPGKQITRDYLLPKTSTKELLVSDLVGNELVTIGCEDDLAKAARLMVEYKISGIPVVDEYGNLEGVISTTDVIRAYHEVKVHSMLKRNDPHFA